MIVTLALSLPAGSRWCSLIANGVFHNKNLSLEAHDTNNIRHVVASLLPWYCLLSVINCFHYRLNDFHCSVCYAMFNDKSSKVYNASIILRNCNEVRSRCETVFRDCPSRCRHVRATDQELHVHVEALRYRSGEPSTLESCLLHSCVTVLFTIMHFPSNFSSLRDTESTTVRTFKFRDQQLCWTSFAPSCPSKTRLKWWTPSMTWKLPWLVPWCDFSL